MIETAAEIQARQDMANGLPVRGETRVGLGAYIQRHAGECRHMALDAGYIIEKMIAEGRILGGVSVDRRSYQYGGGHAWARYTHTQKGMPIFQGNRQVVEFIDPAQGRVLTLDNPLAEVLGYKRPEDYMDQKGDPELLNVIARLF